MKMEKAWNPLTLLLLPLACILFLVACPTETQDGGIVLDIPIDKNNDSLLTFDTLIIKVYSKDSSFSQEVFHGKLTDPKQIMDLPLDPQVGREFTVSMIGYKDGKVGMHKEIMVHNLSPSGTKDLPVKDTVQINPSTPEILAPADTFVSEGSTLRFRIDVRNPWSGAVSISLKDAPAGAALDTTGTGSLFAYFNWTPNHNQGREAAYLVTVTFASADRKIEKTIAIKVGNVNRAPKITPIVDQKVKENETLGFNVAASDPDGDSLDLIASGLPTGAQFLGGAFTWKPTVGQAGNYSVKIKAFDGKDSDFVAVLITVGDVDPPPALTLKIVSPSRDTAINTSPISISFTVNGTLIRKDYPLKDGKNRIYVDTTVAGRTAFDTITITLDQVPPGKPVVSGPNATNKLLPRWTWTSGSGGAGIYRHRLNVEDLNSALPTRDTFFIPAKELEPGSHTLFVQERDEAGNWSATGRHTIRIDTTMPSAPTVTVLPASPSRNTRPTWSWTGSGKDLTGLFRFRLDNSDLLSGASETREKSFTPSASNPLTEGAHTLFVQQQDSAGNWSESGYASIRIDVTPPKVPKVTLEGTSPTNNPRPTWTLASGDGGMGSFRAKLDDSAFSDLSPTTMGLRFTPDSSLKNGRHVLYVQERDSAGNWSATQSSAVTIDLVAPSAPKFDSLPLSPLNSLQPEWAWKSTAGGSGVFRVKLDDTDFSRSADTHSISRYKPGKALTEGSHTLYAQERDSAGNWSSTSSKEIHLALRGPIGKLAFTPGEASYISLAQSPTGELYAGFKDDNIGGWSTVMKFTEGTWSKVGNAGFSVGQVSYFSLAIGAGGKPFAAFQDISNGSKATVMFFNGSAWENVGTPGISPAEAEYVSLALNSKDTAYIAYMDASVSYKASVLRYNGRYWENLGTAGFSAGGATYTAIAINSKGIPYVAYNDGANGNKCTVMRWNGSNWTLVGTAGFSAGGADYINLVFNKADEPYVVYNDNVNGGKVTVMKFNGTAWEPVGSPGFSAGYSLYPSLALSPNGTPYVAYQDAANEDKATVMRFDGKSWQIVGKNGFTAGRASYTSLVVNSSGVPLVAYQDGENANKVSVVKTSFDP